MAGRRHSRKHRSRRHRRSQKQHRRQSRKAQSQRGGQCAAIPLQNSVFAQRGGMAPFEVGGNDLLLDKPTMVQAQSFDQLGMIQEAGRLAAAAQQGGRRRRSRRHRSRRQSRKSRKQQRRSQRGGAAPYNASSLALPISVSRSHGGMNPMWDEFNPVGAQAATN